MRFETGQTTTTQHGNNTQQHTTWCANARNMLGPTMLRLVGQQCCERLHGPLRSPRALLVELIHSILTGSVAIHRKVFAPFLFIAFAPKMIPFFRFSLKLRSFLSLFLFRLSIMCRRVFPESSINTRITTKNDKALCLVAPFVTHN